MSKVQLVLWDSLSKDNAASLHVTVQHSASGIETNSSACGRKITTKGGNIVAKRSKKYIDAVEKVDPHKEYNVKDAIELIKEIDFSNMDSSIDIAYRLDLDVRQADQQLRGSIVLPKGTGNTQTVVVFAKGEKAEEAKQAGADFVGEEDLVEKIQGGWLDFDVAVATPDMMAQVGKLGQILGPKGLMPNPKTGTVTMDVEQAVNNIKAGQVTYRTDKEANIHAAIGKASFSEEDILENLKALHERLVQEKPAAAKGDWMQNLAISTTFGPGVKIDIDSLSAE